MNKIVLITTEGCEGCAIMRNSINKAIALTKKEVTFEVKDITEFKKKDIRTLILTDFPTTIFFKNNRITRKEIGSKPYIVVLRWIDIDF